MIDMHHASGHFPKRVAQRGLSKGDIDFVLAYGQEIHRAGAVFFLLRRKDIPDDLFQQHSRLIGTTILVADQWDELITAYRAERTQMVKNVCRKAKEDLRKFFRFVDDEDCYINDAFLAA